jgi:hypothetical protein
MIKKLMLFVFHPDGVEVRFMEGDAPKGARVYSVLAINQMAPTNDAEQIEASDRLCEAIARQMSDGELPDYAKLFGFCEAHAPTNEQLDKITRSDGFGLN